MIYPCQSKPFIASDAAVAFCFFSAIGKEIGPRGYERKRNLTANLLFKKTKVPHLLKGRFRDDIDIFKRHAPVIPNVERELREKKQNCAKKTKLHHNTLIHPDRTLCQMLWRMLDESLNLKVNFAIFATC